MHPNFAERLFTALRHQPARAVLHWPAAQPGQPPLAVSAAGLLARVTAWQLALEAHGPLPVGTPVLLAYPGSPELVAALLAVLGLGAVPVLPPAGATARQLLALVRRERIGRAVTTPLVQRRLGWLTRRLGCRCVAASPPVAIDKQELALAASPTLRPVPLAQPALVSHSSGSASGRPTAVRRSHQVLQAQHEALRTQFPPWAGQRDFPLFPNVILHNLAVGALSVVPDLPGSRLARLEPARIAAQLAAGQVQTLTGNVFYFNALAAYLSQHPATFPLVRALGVGGSPVPEGLLQKLAGYFPQAVCHVIYGSSEAEPIAVRAVQASEWLAPCRGYCVGAPVAGLQVRLRAPVPVWRPDAPPSNTLINSELEITPWQAGEVLVRGPHVALPAQAAAGGWLATGDFGYFDAAWAG